MQVIQDCSCVLLCSLANFVHASHPEVQNLGMVWRGARMWHGTYVTLALAMCCKN